MDILEGLNPAQREAVEAIEGPLLILAGPGSGKTRVIAHRVAYLVKVWGVHPQHIMAVTFTNKAAREMKERLYGLLGDSVEELAVGTFHAICARILRRDGSHIGVDPNFVIYDDDDQMRLVKRVLQDMDIDPKRSPPRAFLSAISSAKSRSIAPQDYVNSNYFEEVAGRVYHRYQELLEESKALDFDDLLMKAVELFQRQPDVLSKYQKRYRHILVDEFQDTNVVQYMLAKQLAGKHRNICVVGDPDQSIYSWRSADLRNILSFESDYPDARVVYLEQNYRSTKTILEVAHSVISANRRRKEKGLWTDNDNGLPVVVAETYNEQEEAQFVVGEVDRLVGAGSFSLGDFAVMYRTNAQSRVVEEAFIRYGMHYKLVGGTRFYERREVKDIIACLRLIHNPYDSVGLSRIINVPPRGIGQRTLEELERLARERSLPVYAVLQIVSDADGEQPFDKRSFRVITDFLNMLNDLIRAAAESNVVELFDLVIERTGYKSYLYENPDGEDRWENILELRTVAEDYAHLSPDEGLPSFLEAVALVSDTDSYNEKVSAVTLITLHAAKGLEFPVAFILGMEEGLLPHRKSIDEPDQMEEERRLCYVGITRAKQRVYLVRAFRRSSMGATSVNLPSRFLMDVPSHLRMTPGGDVETVRLSPRPFAKKAADYKPPLAAGEKVVHVKFGEGIVVNCVPSGNDQEVTVAFKGEVGLKRLLLSLAPLEKTD
ncbi:MAG: UvrD-helicase domain-containing protein [Chloroflexota bacterium]|nr:UvrD-helicase domain-containing protein [Chloroflexota bacterium]